VVFTVRCFKCGEKDVRLIVGGRSILHARCHSCEANLLDEVMSFEAEVSGAADESAADEHPTDTVFPDEDPSGLAQESSIATLEEDTQARLASD
jgi:hypothetical protein